MKIVENVIIRKGDITLHIIVVQYSPKLLSGTVVGWDLCGSLITRNYFIRAYRVGRIYAKGHVWPFLVKVCRIMVVFTPG